jgi:hypothetical protein
LHAAISDANSSTGWNAERSSLASNLEHQIILAGQRRLDHEVLDRNPHAVPGAAVDTARGPAADQPAAIKLLQALTQPRPSSAPGALPVLLPCLCYMVVAWAALRPHTASSSSAAPDRSCARPLALRGEDRGASW